MDFRPELIDAQIIARAAGAIIMEYYGKEKYSISHKDDSSPVTEADLAANDYILKELSARYPYPILSEEKKDDLARLSAPTIWIVDPLDGTKDFIQKTGEFSVMIGLAEHGKPVLGVVYKPTTNELFFAEKNNGAYREANGTVTPVSVSQKTAMHDMSVVVSRSHTEPESQKIATDMGVTSFFPCGSVGLKISLLVTQQADIYYYLRGYTKEWDTCAPEIILHEAGGCLTDTKGHALVYNQEDVTRPHGVVGTNGNIHTDILRSIEASRNSVAT